MLIASLSFSLDMSALNAALCASMPIICQMQEYGPQKKAGMKRWGDTRDKEAI